MWKLYDVTLKMTGYFAASLPRSEEEIRKMLEHRMPKKPPADYTPIDELTKIVTEKVSGQDKPGEGDEGEVAEVRYGWATFCHDDNGLYYEGRCVRGHIKDCANQIKNVVKPTITALKAKVANRVYVMTDIIPLGVKEPTGVIERFVQVMTRQGPRSTIKYIDYVMKPELRFRLQLLDDDVITEEILKSIFEYGSVHGMGQERSQGWGRYTFELTEVNSPE